MGKCSTKRCPGFAQHAMDSHDKAQLHRTPPLLRMPNACDRRTQHRRGVVPYHSRSRLWRPGESEELIPRAWQATARER